MKNYLKVVVASIIIFAACKEAKKEQEAVTETAIESAELEKYSDKFRKLIVTEEGILRGFNFITDSSEIKRNENAQLLSSDSQALTYAIEFNELESADIIYHLKGNEIDTFEIDLYLKNKPVTDSLANEFKNFYSSKYGNYITNTDTQTVWKDSVNNVGVTLKYINKDIADGYVDHGLNIYLYQNEVKERKLVQ